MRGFATQLLPKIDVADIVDGIFLYIMLHTTDLMVDTAKRS